MTAASDSYLEDWYLRVEHAAEQLEGSQAFKAPGFKRGFTFGAEWAQRDLAARVLPVLVDLEFGDDGGWCPVCRDTLFFGHEGHRPDCNVAALITSLRALVGTGNGQ